MAPIVAVLGTRAADLAIEHEVLAPTGAHSVRGDGADPDGIAPVAGDADGIVAGSRPRFTAAVLDRVLLTPHMAWCSEATAAELRRRSAEEARRVLQGETPRHLSTPPATPDGREPR